MRNRKATHQQRVESCDAQTSSEARMNYLGAQYMLCACEVSVSQIFLYVTQRDH